MAVRIGESWPPQLARQIATLDQISGGRLNINIISSDLPGDKMDSEPRYRRTVEAMQILKTLLNGEHLSIDGEHYKIDLDPPRVKTVSGNCPPLYFGGLSPAAKEAAAEGCDVYLMWPETVHGAKELVDDMTARAAKFGRKLKYGFRAHVIVRETETEARAYADRLLSKLDAQQGEAIRKPMTAISRRICGPGSAARGRAAARRLSVIPTRFWPRSTPIALWGSRRLSCRGTRISMNAICSRAMCCRGWSIRVWWFSPPPLSPCGRGYEALRACSLGEVGEGFRRRSPLTQLRLANKFASLRNPLPQGERD
jgi:Luciferase-like monooxygenase